MVLEEMKEWTVFVKLNASYLYCQKLCSQHAAGKFHWLQHL